MQAIEAQYQDEFYRSTRQVAGREVTICSEWSRTGVCRVYFHIPEKKCASSSLRIMIGLMDTSLGSRRREVSFPVGG
ncbi:hypothetical protein BDV11DRAFT_186130 [Aspergillus similis]